MGTTQEKNEARPVPAERTGRAATQETLRVVVYRLAGHEHAVDVRQVKEIVGASQISPVVEAPDFVEGVIRLRGRIVPIVDLRKRLRLPPAGRTVETCIIVIRQPKGMVGFLVDSASQLLTVPTKRIEPPTEIIGGIRTRFIEGLVYLEERLFVILNLDEVLTVEEKELLGQEEFKVEEDRGELPAIQDEGFRGDSDDPSPR